MTPERDLISEMKDMATAAGTTREELRQLMEHAANEMAWLRKRNQFLNEQVEQCRIYETTWRTAIVACEPYAPTVPKLMGPHDLMCIFCKEIEEHRDGCIYIRAIKYT